MCKLSFSNNNKKIELVEENVFCDENLWSSRGATWTWQSSKMQVEEMRRRIRWLRRRCIGNRCPQGHPPRAATCQILIFEHPAEEIISLIGMGTYCSRPSWNKKKYVFCYSQVFICEIIWVDFNSRRLFELSKLAKPVSLCLSFPFLILRSL